MNRFQTFESYRKARGWLSHSGYRTKIKKRHERGFRKERWESAFDDRIAFVIVHPTNSQARITTVMTRREGGGKVDRAEVVVEHNKRTQIQRLRCQGCYKVAYPTEEAAEAAAQTIVERGGTEMRHYFDEECGWWHVSRVKR